MSVSATTHAAALPQASQTHKSMVGHDAVNGAVVGGSIGSAVGGVAGMFGGSVFNFFIDGISHTDGAPSLGLKLGFALLGATTGGLTGAGVGAGIGAILGAAS